MGSMKRFKIMRVVLAVCAALLAEATVFALVSFRPSMSSVAVVTPAASRDLANIRDEGVLRVAIPEDGLSLHLRAGQPEGFAYDLVRRFALSTGLRLEAVPTDRLSTSLRDLNRGSVDMIAVAGAGTVPMMEGLGWSVPISKSRPMLVGRTAGEIHSFSELAGKTVAVRRFSPWEAQAQQWRLQLYGQLTIVPVPPDHSDADLIEEAAQGKFSLVLLDEARARLESSLYPGLQHSAPLGEPQPVRWAIRGNAPELSALLDQFLTLSRDAGLVSDIERRYLENPLRLRVVRRIPAPPVFEDHLTPFDDIFRLAANHNGLDWRLLAAIGQIESSFDPAAEGEGGAAGIMQLMPRTAEAFGAADPYDASQNVQAAARHLKWIADQLSDVPAEERMEFVIAAHNMGLGHVLDAQELARQRGLDPLRWDENVAVALPLMEIPEVAATLTHGRARGSFTLGYVQRVRSAYARYTQGAGEEQIARAPGALESR